MDETVLSLLRVMTEMTTLTPTLKDIVEAAPGGELHADRTLSCLEAALEAGMVDAAEDCGPDTIFCLSVLGAARMGVCPTFDSRRWAEADTGHLVGPHDVDGRYRSKRADRSPDPAVPLHERVDRRQSEPHEILAEAERAAAYAADRAAGKPYSSENPPYIRSFYGIGAIWAGEDPVRSPCPYCCKSVPMGIDGYCVKCHRSGMDGILAKPEKSRRRQMPEHASSLKGGV